MKMSYYSFNKTGILQKAKEKYDNGGGKEKAAEYYKTKKDVLKENARNKYKNIRKRKRSKKGYSKNSYKEMKNKFKFIVTV